MGLYSEFIQDYRRAQQESKAVRGVARPTGQQLSAVSGRAATRASAETTGRIAGEEREQALEDITASGERFTAGLGIEKRRSKLAEEASLADIALGREHLSLEEGAMERGRRIWPWALGLRAGELVGTHFEAGAERKRQTERDILLRDILRTSRPRRRRPVYDSGVPGRGDLLSP